MPDNVHALQALWFNAEVVCLGRARKYLGIKSKQLVPRHAFLPPIAKAQYTVLHYDNHLARDIFTSFCNIMVAS